MRIRSAFVWGAAAAVLVTSLFSMPAAPADAAALRRQVPDAPTIHVATTDEALAMQADLVAQARAGGTVAQIPVEHTEYSNVFLMGLNRQGTVVGYGMVSPYKAASRDLLLVHDGTSDYIGRTTGDPPLGDRSAFGQAINRHDVVTGVAPCQCNRTEPGEPASVAFRWSRADGFSYAPMPPGVIASTGVAINDKGLILVNSWASPSPSDDGAWLWDPKHGTVEKLEDLGGGAATGTALNNDGTVVGYAPVGDVDHAVRWGWGRRHHIRDLAPGPLASHATDINVDGTIVGWQGTHALAWLGNGARARDLGQGEALAINGRDQVVGNVVLATVVPDDGGLPVEVTVAAVYDLWAPQRRAVLDVDRLFDYSPTRLDDAGLVVNWQSMWGPATLPRQP